MNWLALGSIGDVVGALGVMGSLIYLASQIRNQNIESQLTAVHNMTSQWNAFMGDMAANPELARIWAKGIASFESLGPVEQVQFSTHLNRIFRIVESMYHQQQSGRLQGQTWQGIENSVSDLTRCPGVKSWWPTRAHWYSLDYREFIQPYIDKTDASVLYPPTGKNNSV